MEKMKKAGVVILLILITLAIIAGYFYMTSWPLRFRGEFNDFFGKGNWEWISTREKDSMIFDEYHMSGSSNMSSETRPGRYHDWEISYEDQAGTKENWYVTDHAYRINHSRNHIFSQGRYTAKQAMTQELMEISFASAEEAVHREILDQVLPENESRCLGVDLMYRDGNPSGKFYDKLRKEEWFHADKASAEKYLETDIYDFYLYIRAFDYRMEDLTEEEREHLMKSLPDIESALKTAYGEAADYEIYLDEGVRAKYGHEEQ